MLKRPRKRCTRKRRLRRNLLFLAALFLLAYIVEQLAYLSFPLPYLAFRATERSYLFGPGEVLMELDGSVLPTSDPLTGEGYPSSYQIDRAYVTRYGDWYGYCTLLGGGLRWFDAGKNAFHAVEVSEETPITFTRADGFRTTGQLLLVISTLPEVASVEVTYPASNGMWRLLSDRDAYAENGCFMVPLREVWQNFHGSEEVRLRGYDAAGNLICETPTPAVWAEEYGITQ